MGALEGKGGDPPFVSVVVPTADRHDALSRCLETLLSQHYPRDRYEIVVVHNGEGPALSTDVGEPAPSLLHVALPERDANAARNAGVAAARGDPICLVDDDVLAPPGWLAALVHGLLRHPAAECAGGPVRPVYEHRRPRTCDRHDLAGGPLDYGSAEREVDEVWGCNMAVRRAAVARVGRFREGMARAQEWEWEHRLLSGGGSILYVPGAWLWHRRFADDLRLRRLIPDAFLRGYVVGRQRPRRSVRLPARRAAGALLHGGRRACTRGLTDALRHAGELWGTIVARARGALR